MDNPELKPSDIMAQQRTVLAAERTVMAAGRSLLAWIRTGLSMIGFGFTIYKFLQGFQADLVVEELNNQTPRTIGIFLIALGTASVLFGVMDYWQTTRGVHKTYGTKVRLMPVIFAVLIAALGLAMLLGITLRIGSLS